MIKLTPLFSGSRGNCTLVQTPDANILIDAGYGFRATAARLAQCNLTPSDISAIVVTHEHSDHISALPQFARHSPATVYVPEAAMTYVAQTCFCSNIQSVSSAFRIADALVEVYCCSHDSRACLGYRFTAGGDSVASVTDTGIAVNLAGFLAPCRTVILESNHDVAMLENGNYPYYLKRRIRSEFGHLSNDQCAEVLKQIVGTRVQNVVLAHLSQQNNTPLLAMQCAERALSQCGAKAGKDIMLYVADQYQNGVTL